MMTKELAQWIRDEAEDVERNGLTVRRVKFAGDVRELCSDYQALLAENQRMREALDWGDTTWHQASWAGRETWWKELRRRATDGPKEAK